MNGPAPFNVVGVWTHRKPDYVPDLLNILEHHRELFAAALTVVAGDFNSNANWDKPRSSRPDHSRMVVRLAEEFGLVSAYHEHFAVPHGKERHPTY